MKLSYFFVILVTIHLSTNLTGQTLSFHNFSGMGYRLLSATSTDPNAGLIIDARKSEKPNFQLTQALVFTRSIYNKISIGLGVGYSILGYKIKDDYETMWPSEITPNGFVDDPSLPNIVKLVDRHEFVDFILRFEKEWQSKGKLKVIPYADFIPSLYIISGSYAVFGSKSFSVSNVNKNPNFNTVSSSIRVGCNLKYLITPRWNISLGIQGRSQLTPLNKTGIIAERLLHYGLDLAFGYTFNTERT
jgi:hypothetical protein